MRTKEQRKLSSHLYYLRNKERFSENSRKYREAHPVSEEQRKKNNAVRRKRYFEDEEFRKKQSEYHRRWYYKKKAEALNNV